jgi:hypothetical protein
MHHRNSLYWCTYDVIGYFTHKRKAVPQHTLCGAGGSGYIDPTHSQHRHWMGISGQNHAPATLYPWGKDSQYPLDMTLDGPQSQSGQCLQQKSSCLCWGSNLDCPVVVCSQTLYWLSYPSSQFHLKRCIFLKYQPWVNSWHPLLEAWCYDSISTSHHCLYSRLVRIRKTFLKHWYLIRSLNRINPKHCQNFTLPFEENGSIYALHYPS